MNKPLAVFLAAVLFCVLAVVAADTTPLWYVTMNVTTTTPEQLNICMGFNTTSSSDAEPFRVQQTLFKPHHKQQQQQKHTTLQGPDEEVEDPCIMEESLGTDIYPVERFEFTTDYDLVMDVKTSWARSAAYFRQNPDSTTPCTLEWLRDVMSVQNLAQIRADAPESCVKEDITSSTTVDEPVDMVDGACATCKAAFPVVCTDNSTCVHNNCSPPPSSLSFLGPNICHFTGLPPSGGDDDGETPGGGDDGETPGGGDDDGNNDPPKEDPKIFLFAVNFTTPSTEQLNACIVFNSTAQQEQQQQQQQQTLSTITTLKAPAVQAAFNKKFSVPKPHRRRGHVALQDDEEYEEPACEMYDDFGTDIYPVERIEMIVHPSEEDNEVDVELLMEVKTSYVVYTAYYIQNMFSTANCTEEWLRNTMMPLQLTRMKANASPACNTEAFEAHVADVKASPFVDGVCEDCLHGFPSECTSNSTCFHDCVHSPNLPFGDVAVCTLQGIGGGSDGGDGGDDDDSGDDGNTRPDPDNGAFVNATEAFLITMTVTAANTEQLDKCIDLSDQEDEPFEAVVQRFVHKQQQQQQQQKYKSQQLGDDDDDDNNNPFAACNIWVGLGLNVFPVANVRFEGDKGQYLKFNMQQKWVDYSMYVAQNNEEGAPKCDKKFVENVFIPYLAAQLHGEDPSCASLAIAGRVVGTFPTANNKCPTCQGGLAVECAKNGDCLSDNCMDVPDIYKNNTSAEKVCFLNTKTAPANTAMQTTALMAVVAAIVGVAMLAF